MTVTIRLRHVGGEHADEQQLAEYIAGSLEPIRFRDPETEEIVSAYDVLEPTR